MLIGEEIIQGHEAHLVKYNYHSKKLLESSKFLLFKKMNISQDEENLQSIVSYSKTDIEADTDSVFEKPTESPVLSAESPKKSCIDAVVDEDRDS